MRQLESRVRCITKILAPDCPTWPFTKASTWRKTNGRAVKKRTQSFLINAIPLTNTKDHIVHKVFKIILYKIRLSIFPATDIHKLSTPHTHASRISMTVLSIHCEPTYKERRGLCFSLHTHLIENITDFFSLFLKAQLKR